MINELQVANYAPRSKILYHNGDIIQIKTCQRNLLIGYNILKFYKQEGSNDGLASSYYEGEDAYQFLLEVISGLHSKLIGESEVVAQFKESYQSFKKQDYKNPLILTTLENLFKDAKKIRTKNLNNIGQLSYAGITKKLILSNGQTDNILVLGSGALAKSLIKVLSKKANIYISARNSLKVNSIIKSYPNIKAINWNQFPLYQKFSKIICTIGSEQILLDQQFFLKWHQDKINQEHAFVDLGSPSSIDTPLGLEENITRLDDIFEISKRLNTKKEDQIKKAKSAIKDLSRHRQLSYSIQFPFGWEELQFA